MLVIRHAESEWNAFSSKMTAQGKKDVQELHRQDYEPKSLSKDPPITEKGISQAKSLAESLLPYLDSLQVIFVSPCQRALQTLGFALEEMVQRGAITRSGFAEKVKIVCQPLVLPRMSGVIDFPFRYPKSKEIIHKDF